MEEIDLKDMFNYFLTKIIYIVLITVLAIMIGVVYSSFIQKPEYKSYTTILLTKERESTSITSSDVTLNQKLVDTYREIIKSRKVISRVINNLNLDYSIEELSSKINVESINNTEIIKISVTDADSELACAVANETASVFNSEIVKLYNIQNIGIVDMAEVSKNPYNVNVPRQIVLSALVGIVLGLGVVFVIYYFDKTIKSVDEVEKRLGLPIIGTIPNAGGRR